MRLRKKYSMGLPADEAGDSRILRKSQRLALSAALLLLVCFCYSVLRSLKDTIVITASSAAVIPFIKVWAILPVAILATFFYAKLSSLFSFEKVFAIAVSIFLTFFLVFAFFIYPNSEFFQLDGLSLFLRSILPKGCDGLVAMVEHWSLTLFYCMAELWSNIILSVITWGFINQITNLNDARRTYSILGASSNIAAILAGFFANQVLSYNSTLTWTKNFQVLICAVCIAGVAAVAIFYKLNEVTRNERASELKKADQKIIFSLSDCIKEILRSKHLMCLAIIVIAYFFSINTVEVVWKEHLRLAYPSPSDFGRYMNSLTMYIGFFSTLLALAMPYFIRRHGFTRTALFTPGVMFVTSIMFFAVLTFQMDLAPAFAMLGTTPLMFAVLIGGVQNCLSKSAKYSIFDSTKEMAFIPLSREQQLKGKAAIDGIGSRLGKSGGSIAHQGMLLAFGGLAGSTPIIGGILITVIGAWILATKSLGKNIDAKLSGTYLGKIETIDASTEDKQAPIFDTSELALEKN